MPRAKLELRLSRTDGAYRPGEVMEGTLDVEVLEDVGPVRLGLSRRWTLSWPGGSRKGEAPEVPLVQAVWKAGERHAVPFQIPVPLDPPGYAGALWAVEWSLAVCGWKGDPVQAPFRVLSLPSRALTRRPSDLRPLESATKGRAAGRAVGMGCGLLFVAGIGLLGVYGGRQVDPGWAATLVGGAGGVLLGLPIAWIIGRTVVDEAGLDAKLGDVQIATYPPDPRPGEPVSLAIEFTPREDVRLVSAEAELTGRETLKLVRTTLKPGVYDEHMESGWTHAQRTPLAARGVLPAGRPVRWESSLVLPENAPVSFSQTLDPGGTDTIHLDMAWSLEVRIQVEGIETPWDHPLRLKVS